MRWMILMAMVVVGSATVRADEKPFDQRRAVEDVLHGNEMAWSNQKALLLKRSSAELVTLLGAVRKAAAQERCYDMSSPLAAEPGSEEAQAALEAEAALLGKCLQAKDPWRATVRTWMVRLSNASTGELLGTAAKPQVEGRVLVISAARAQALLDSLASTTGVRPEPMPVLRLMAGQLGRVEHGARFSYVQDYEVEVGMGGSWITGPVIGTLGEGAQVHVTAAPTKATGAKTPATLTVDVKAVWSAVRRPIETFDTALAAMQEDRKGQTVVRIQLPELQVFMVRGAVSVPRQAWIAVVAGRRADEPEARVMLLQVDAN